MMVIDRIEGDFAIVEVNGKTMDVPLSELPQGVREGQVLKAIGDNSETALPQSLVERVERLRKQDPGDIEIDI